MNINNNTKLLLIVLAGFTLAVLVSSCGSSNAPSGQRNMVDARLQRAVYTSNGYTATTPIIIHKIDKGYRTGDVVLIEDNYYKVESIPGDNILLNYEYAISLEDDKVIIRTSDRGLITVLPMDSLGKFSQFLWEDNE